MSDIGGLCDRLEAHFSGRSSDAAVSVRRQHLDTLIAAARERDRLRAAVLGLADEWERRNYDSGDPYTVGHMAGLDTASARLRALVADTTGEA